MRFIIHKKIDSKSTPDSYNLGKIMLYYLGEKIHLSGISESIYFMIDNLKNADIKYKLQLLIAWSEGENKQQYEEIQVSVKEYQKIKNKDSKVIVNYNLLKKGIDSHFEILAYQKYEQIDKVYDIISFKELIDHKKVNFYHNELSHGIYNDQKITTITDILSLQLLEEDGECPILFLTNENNQGKPNLELIVYSPKSEEANKLDEIYLTDVFQFPPVVGIPISLMKSMTLEFSKKTISFKEKLHKWAKICYDNPNTSNGLTFFRAEIVPLIEEHKKIGLETDVGKDISKAAKSDSFGCLQFGEMPVEKIWQLMLANLNCSEQEYQELLKIKDAQSPKYDGRWPVVFFREEGTQKMREEEEQAMMPSRRKTLDID